MARKVMLVNLENKLDNDPVNIKLLQQIQYGSKSVVNREIRNLPTYIDTFVKERTNLRQELNAM